MSAVFIFINYTPPPPPTHTQQTGSRENVKIRIMFKIFTRNLLFKGRIAFTCTLQNLTPKIWVGTEQNTDIQSGTWDPVLVLSSMWESY